MSATAKRTYDQIHNEGEYAEGKFLAHVNVEISENEEWENETDEIGADVHDGVR
jgi:hypothetical protein